MNKPIQMKKIKFLLGILLCGIAGLIIGYIDIRCLPAVILAEIGIGFLTID